MKISQSFLLDRDDGYHLLLTKFNLLNKNSGNLTHFMLSDKSIVLLHERKEFLLSEPDIKTLNVHFSENEAVFGAMPFKF